jgi:large subunit ribosomal protein L4e
MFAPTKTWRRWHRKINISQKRYAVASALAASAVPALVMARGHKIDDVPEIPLVIENELESKKKTSEAKDILSAIGALADVEKAADSKKIRAGKGKARNRKYVLRRGPLIIYKTNDGVERAFRNLPGVELCCVDRLNLLQLAPGGHMGRFCIWSQAALDELNIIYGAEGKDIPSDLMANADLARIINSDEIQSVLNPAKRANKVYLRKKNPLVSIKALAKLDPYAAAARASEQRAEAARKDSRAANLKKKRDVAKSKLQYRAAGKAYYEKVSKQGDVCSEGFMVGKI